MDTAVVGLFTQIDANGDGVVTMRELTMALRKDRGLGKRLRPQVRRRGDPGQGRPRKEIEEFFLQARRRRPSGASAARVLRSPSTGRTPAAVARSHRRDAALRRGPRAGVRRRGPPCKVEDAQVREILEAPRETPSFRWRSGWRWTA